MPLAQNASVTLSELADHPLALMRKKSGYGAYDKVTQCFVKSGVTPFIQFDASDVPMLVSLVQDKLAVALMPMLSDSQWTDIVTLPIPELDCVADDLVLIYLAQKQTESLRQIINIITSNLSDQE